MKITAAILRGGDKVLLMRRGGPPQPPKSMLAYPATLSVNQCDAPPFKFGVAGVKICKSIQSFALIEILCKIA